MESQRHRPGVQGVVGLLEHAITLGAFCKMGKYDYTSNGCAVCSKTFKADSGEIMFDFPMLLSFKGVDLPYDLTADSRKLCLPCLIKVVDQFPDSRPLREIGEYARARYAADKDTVYVPQALDGDAANEAAKSGI